ncbi:MAG: hypothetical protein K9H49_13675 [Bacteroidales bacterium]|nr:hypothetical protein [Bacteroidales bacterium]MCF8390503.1 hypothetical protein [Bacteroidales bacterium]
MTISQLVELLGLEVVCGQERIDEEVEFAFASDLMSDVLTLDKSGVLLITGLANPQAVRTSEIADVTAIIIARGKTITQEMSDLAEEGNMILLTSKLSVFKIAGELYSAGIKAIY